MPALTTGRGTLSLFVARQDDSPAETERTKPAGALTADNDEPNAAPREESRELEAGRDKPMELEAGRERDSSESSGAAGQDDAAA